MIYTTKRERRKRPGCLLFVLVVLLLVLVWAAQQAQNTVHTQQESTAPTESVTVPKAQQTEERSAEPPLETPSEPEEDTEEAEEPLLTVLPERPVSRPQTAVPAPEPVIEEEQDLALLLVVHSRIVVEEGLKYLDGVVRNNGSEHYRYIELQAEIFDESGQYISTVVTSTQRRGTAPAPGETWHFRVFLPDFRSDNYRISLRGW